MSIRAFKSMDGQAVSDLVRNALRTSNAADYEAQVIDRLVSKFSPEYFEMKACDQQVLVAEQQGSIVGTARVDSNEIKTVFVSPDAQGQGIGTRLMQAAESCVREQGYESAVLFASTTARTFYEHIGYAPEAQVHDEMYGQVTRMRKSL